MRIVGVSLDFGTPEKVTKHCNAKGWGNIEHYVMPDSTVRAAFGIQGVPHVMLIDKQGQVVFKNHPGYIVNLEKAIDMLLKGETIFGEDKKDK